MGQLMYFDIKDKSEYILLTQSNITARNIYDKHFKDIFDKNEENINKYLLTIFASYNVCKKLYDNEFNIGLKYKCPIFEYAIFSNRIVFQECGTIYSFFDYYKKSPVYEHQKNKYPAYSIHYILKNYVEDILGIEVTWECIDSPCTKNTFLVKVKDANDEYEYIRNKDDINEFENTVEGIKDAAFRIFLFYNKYIK